MMPLMPAPTMAMRNWNSPSRESTDYRDLPRHLLAGFDTESP
jgi:hypothetical protein